jgi:acyl-CoA synthetase (AMP-forming)/AMP-acid ligase II
MSPDLDPGPLLEAVGAFRGSFHDLDRGSERGSEITAAAFARGWRALAGRLGENGLEAGDRVVLAVGNGPLFPAALAAVLARGGSPLLLHGDTPAAEVRRNALRIGARFALTDADADAADGRLVDAGFATLFWREIDGAEPPGGPRLEGVPLHPTSGTTGQSKIALRPGFPAMEEARHYVETIGVDERDVLLVAVPMSHAYGYGMGTMVPLLRGARVLTQRRFQPKSCLRALRELGVTVFPAAPAMLDLMLLAGDWPSPPPRCVLTAGAPLPARTAAAFAEKTGGRVRPLYGTTETGGITIDTLDEPGAPSRVGPPMDGVEVEIRDAGVVGEEKVGRVWVRSSSRMTGYLEPAGIDTAVLPDGWFATGDLGYVDELGAVHLVAREKEVINVFGLKVVPGEVEAVLCALDGVAEAKVYAGEHRSGSQIVKAALAAASGIDVPAVRAHCERHLAPYKRPEIIHLLPELPRTPAGKIWRDRLP